MQRRLRPFPHDAPVIQRQPVDAGPRLQIFNFRHRVIHRIGSRRYFTRCRNLRDSSDQGNHRRSGDRRLLSPIRLRKPPLRGSHQCNRNIAMITKKHFRQPLAIPIIHQGKTSTRRRSRTKTLLLDAMALGPAGSRRLIHCAIINNERGNSNRYCTYRIGSIQGKGACHRCRMRPAQSWLS